MSITCPEELIGIVNNIAEIKKKSTRKKTFVLAVLAGAYIALGGLLAVIIGGGMPGVAIENPGLQKFVFGAVFPLGLVLCVLVGADLFTGNTAYFAAPLLSKKMSVWKVVLKSGVLVYLGNFVGSIIVAFFLVYITGLFSASPWNEFILNVSEAKVSMTFSVAFWKAVGCNWLVALALWQGMAAKDATGKILGIWFPIMAFVAVGFEHCVANMFFIPAGIFYGADVTWGEFFLNNLVPVTLGNIVGGFVFVGMAYWYVYGREN